MINYSRILDQLLESVDESGTIPRLLLHACCGPCASYVLELLTQHFDITVLFYNPNIRPGEEYQKRLETLRHLIAKMSAINPISLLEDGYHSSDYAPIWQALPNEPEGGSRCSACFYLRLRKSAEIAENLGFDYFCSTLTVSPHKNAQLINSIGFAIAEELRINWLPSDFKKRDGYKRSLELSREYGLYRQNYCGCTPNTPSDESIKSDNLFD